MTSHPFKAFKETAILINIFICQIARWKRGHLQSRKFFSASYRKTVQRLLEAVERERVFETKQQLGGGGGGNNSAAVAMASAFWTTCLLFVTAFSHFPGAGKRQKIKEGFGQPLLLDRPWKPTAWLFSICCGGDPQLCFSSIASFAK